MDNKEKKTVYFKRSKYRSEDFTENDLPLTRGSQYFDIFKHEWKTLLLIGVVLFLFSLLYLAVDFFHWFIARNLPDQLLSQGSTEEEIYAALQFTEMMYEVALVIATLILMIPLAGISRVFKRMIHGEGLLFRADFLEGIKMNIIHFLILGFIYAFLRFSVQFVYIFVENVPYLAEITRGITMGVMYGLFFPIIIFMFAQDSIYKMNLWTNFKNSYQLTIRSILVMLLFSFIIFGVYFMRYIQNIILKESLYTILIIGFAPYYLLAISSFTMSRFDKFINQEYYPEIYRKGLRPYVDTHQTNNL